MTTSGNADLLLAVQERMPTALLPLGFAIVEHQEGTSFDIASVSLQSRALRINIERERGPITVGFASPAAPNQSFDSAVVLEFLGLSLEGTLTSSHVTVLLTGLEHLLHVALPELERHFSPSELPKTRAALETIRNAQAERRWPSKQHGAT